MGACLQLTPAVRDSTLQALKAALRAPDAGGGDATASSILAAFVDAESAVLAVCAALLDSVREDLVVTRSLITRKVSVVGQKRKPTVVIIGGVTVDSIRMDPAVERGQRLEKGQRLGAFARGGSAMALCFSGPAALVEKCRALLEFHGRSTPLKLRCGASLAEFR